MILLHFNKIVLVGNDYDLYVGLCMLINLLEPVVEVEEGLSIEEVEDEYDTICSFVVSICDGPIPLLSSRIPNLKLNLFAVVSQ